VADARLPLPLNISASKRLAREWQTMAAMVADYCFAHHGPGVGLCPECRGLLDYATVRLDRCRYGRNKPTCANCPVHCYQRNRRDEMKTVMSHAGPRMLWRHPVMSLRHWLDGFRRAPSLPAEVNPPQPLTTTNGPKHEYHNNG
jgi:Nitrous oxide-stimulated promoter